MSSLRDYQLIESIHHDGHTHIYRAKRMGDDLNVVILKKLGDDRPSPRERAQLRREYALGRRLIEAGVTGIVRPLALDERRDPPLLVMEDLGGETLADRLKRARPTLEEALNLGVGIAQSLAELHANAVVHKDIKPGNILVTRAGAVCLFDFGLSSTIARESHAATTAPARMEGTLLYMAPEQTGQVGRPIDARTDLYSLGAVLYELLTGVRPFTDTDPVALVHAHIARRPPSLRTHNPQLPAVIDELVLRLLEKAAEKRYQTAAGVAADLHGCLEGLRVSSTLAPFRLGQHDLTDRLEPPKRLYGRDTEVAGLAEAFSVAASGQSGLALVFGYSGIGKTSLVDEIHGIVVGRNGRFLRGKFDQFKRNIPFASVVHALQGLVDSLASESEEVRAEWKSRIGRALGELGGVVVEVLPDLADLMGPQPAVPELEPEPTRLRFVRTMLAFVGALTTREQPLVLFLDDLQWADQGSLDLLRALVTQRGRGHLLVIGAYRNNEIDPGHALSIELDRIRKERQVLGLRPVMQIELGPLAHLHVMALLADTLHREPEQIGELADLVLEKTAGNPFFMHEFLRKMYRQGGIHFVQGRGFGWALDLIRLSTTTDNVVELLLERIRLLPPAAQRALQYSACLGAEFDFETLAQVMDVGAGGRTEFAEDVSMLVADGLILPLDGNYNLMGLTDDQSIAARYQFQHDRVQQAAYALWADDELAGVHLEIARHLRMALSPEALEERHFEIADHLLRGLAAIDTVGAREDAAGFVFVAGRRAKHASAYGPALRYLTVVRTLLGETFYTSGSVDGVAVVSMMAQCEYLLGLADDADRHFQEMFDHARNDHERAESFVVRVELHVSKGNILEGLNLAVQGLALCGETLDLAPTPEMVGAAFADLNAAIAGRTLAEIAELPEPENLLKSAALEILNDTVAPAYYVNENVYAIIILKMCTISARYGQSPVSPFGWALYGVVAGSILGDFEGGKAAARTARRVQARFNRVQLVPKLRLCLEGFVDPWTQPPLDGMPGLIEGTRVGLDAGDPVFATFCAMSLGYIWLQTGLELEELEDEATRWGGYIRALGVAECAEAQEVNLRLAQSLRQSVECGPVELGADEATFLARLDSFTLRIPYHMALLAKMELALVMNDLDAGLPLIAKSAALEARSIGTGHSSQHAWLTGLLLLKAMARDPAFATEETRATLDAQMARVRAWAAANPFAFRHKILGLEAALDAIEGRVGSALEKYERAVVEAEENGYVKNAALLAEMAGQVHLQLGQSRLWLFYLRDARSFYERWGATRKVRALDARHPDLVPVQQSAGGSSRAHSISAGNTSSGAHSSAELDALSIVRASQAISGEIILERLAERLLEILLQSGGAQRAIFYIVEQGNLQPIGAARSDSKALPAAEEALDVCQAALNYAVRQRSVAVIEDTADAGMFATDPYVRAGKTLSLLALPVMRQGVVKGLIYLENGLTRGAFTTERLGLLGILGSQLAISIENALLYRNLERQSSSFARFVPRQFLELLQRGSVLDVQLGDAVRREMAVMFTDIRSYTTMSETMSPEENFAFVNEYMTRMGPAVREHGGFIDKYIGDAIMALFPRTADDAVSAGVEMLRRLTLMNADRSAAGVASIHAGIGLHAGSLMLGIVGEQERLEGTVISDVVNTASRIEGLCKFFGASFVISEAILSRCAEPDRYPHRYLGSVAVAGKRDRLRVYEVFAADPPELVARKLASRGEFEAATESLEQGDFDVAAERFQAIVRRSPDDDAAQSHLGRAASADGRMTAPKR